MQAAQIETLAFLDQEHFTAANQLANQLLEFLVTLQ